MKNRALKLILTLLLLTFISLFCLTSCGVLESIYLLADIYDSEDEIIEDESGDLILGIPSSDDNEDKTENNSSNKNQDEEEIDIPSGDSTNNTIIIEGSESNIVYAASAGARSAVSVYAEFSSGAYTGSGVIYDLDENNGSAFIITNYHVIYYSSRYSGKISEDIKVFLYGMESESYAIPATFVGGSPNYDIAILRVDNSEILKSAANRGVASAVTIADSNNILIGQTAIAIGNPESSGISVTSGIVSVDSEYITMSSINGKSSVEFRVMRIDTAVNSGNSGGGLFDDQGHLIGIVNAKISSSDVENIGYAIPISIVTAVADNIIYNCYGNSCQTMMRALLGVEIVAKDLSTEYDSELGILQKLEVIAVSSVGEDGIANGKLEVDDIIKSISVAGKTAEVTRRHHVIDTMLNACLDDVVEITVMRDGVEIVVSITITQDCLTEY